MLIKIDVQGGEEDPSPPFMGFLPKKTQFFLHIRPPPLWVSPNPLRLSQYAPAH